MTNSATTPQHALVTDIDGWTVSVEHDIAGIVLTISIPNEDTHMQAVISPEAWNTLRSVTA